MAAIRLDPKLNPTTAHIVTKPTKVSQHQDTSKQAKLPQIKDTSIPLPYLSLDTLSCRFKVLPRREAHLPSVPLQSSPPPHVTHTNPRPHTPIPTLPTPKPMEQQQHTSHSDQALKKARKVKLQTDENPVHFSHFLSTQSKPHRSLSNAHLFFSFYHSLSMLLPLLSYVYDYAFLISISSNPSHSAHPLMYRIPSSFSSSHPNPG